MQQSFMKIIHHVLLSWKKDTLKETKQNIFLPNSFSPVIFRRMVICIQQVCSCDNLADDFTKSLPSKVFEKLVLRIGLLRIFVFMRGRNKCVLHSFFLHQGFVPLGFPGKVFNEAVRTQKDIVLFFLHYNFFPLGFILVRF
jgi:hypothetical protein